MNFLDSIQSFLRAALHSLTHRLAARGIHLLHSPFVYSFATEVLPHRRSVAGRKAGELHRRLKASKEVIVWEDLGAGSSGSGQGIKRMPLGKIARRSGCPRKKGELLHRICRHYRPAVCLELGTNLGISTLYQYSAVPHAHFVTLEGAPELAAVARKQFSAYGLAPELIVGEFSHLLEEMDWDSFLPEYIYLDGNHRYAPTLEYFHTLLPRIADGGLMVFDDIYWSPGMRKAWREICAHPEVSVSIDLFSLGLCFIRRPQAKEHFTMRA